MTRTSGVGGRGAASAGAREATFSDMMNMAAAASFWFCGCASLLRYGFSRAPLATASHYSTFQLDLSAFCGMQEMISVTQLHKTGNSG